MEMLQRVSQTFVDRFGASPEFIVRAPGRVNLIGEHTDYNDGFCLPMAIDRAVWMALRPRQNNKMVLHSLDFAETISFELNQWRQGNENWHKYIEGVAWALQQNGYNLSAWEGVICSNVSIGSGLSSSAALELATARAFAAASGFEWDAVRMARIGQQAENGWLGLKTGIMDQLISATGVAGHALLIDCRSLSLEPAPLPPETAVVVMDTKTSRGLVDSAYNERRSACEEAAQNLSVAALRDVSYADFERHAKLLDPVVRRRARHVITENERTLMATQALRQGKARQVGQLMNDSHKSLRDDFEVSSVALDTMVELAQDHVACYGARMTGAGFGGCAVALVDADGDKLRGFIDHVEEGYQAIMHRPPSVFVCQAAAGASLV